MDALLTGLVPRAFQGHRDHWAWVGQGTEAHYQTNVRHGRGADSKNLLLRLRRLDMADEIATDGVLHVRWLNLDFLLKVLAGEFDYEPLVGQAGGQLERVKQACVSSTLPEEPDRDRVNQMLIQIRRKMGG